MVKINEAKRKIQEITIEKDYQAIDFGVVAPGKTFRKKIYFPSCLSITSMDKKNPLPFEEALFSIEKCNSSGKPPGNMFLVTFKPTVSRTKSFSHVVAAFEDGHSLNIFLLGKTKGSSIKFTSSSVNFHTSESRPADRFVFVMENSANSCSDRFNWDFVAEDSAVQIDPMFGKIPPNGRINVTVQFKPRTFGLYYHSFSCVFQHHEPLYFEVFGNHSKHNTQMDLKKNIYYNTHLPTYRTNFCRYVNNVVHHVPKYSRPPISLSNRYIHFQNESADSDTSSFVQHLSLTNHDNNELLVTWSSVKTSIFHIHPNSVTLTPRGGTVKFAVTYCPVRYGMIDRGELYASFWWGEKKRYLIPYTATVHLIGDSFRGNGCKWSSAYPVESDMIVLPGTVPNYPTYTVFRIIRSGVLPLHFQLKPIDETNYFVVKPRQGLITDTFQLVVVQFVATSKADVIHRENWLLILNTIIEVKLELVGSCELPYINSTEGKDIQMPSTALMSYSYRDIIIHNPTRLELKYRLGSSYSQGDFSDEPVSIGPGEKRVAKIGFRAPSLGRNSSILDIRYNWQLTSIAQKLLQGSHVRGETFIIFRGMVEEDVVTVSTDHLMMKDVFSDDWTSEEFTVSNEGSSSLNIKLSLGNSMLSNIKKWKIVPEQFVLNEKQYVKVKLYVLGQEVGFHRFFIEYALYTSNKFMTRASNWKRLMVGDVLVYFLSLKVKDVRSDGLCTSLSKQVLWSSLKIDKLNHILDNLHDNTKHTLAIRILEYDKATPPLKVELLLKNTCSTNICLEVKLKKLCKCEPQRKDTISRRFMDHSCFHDKEVTASISDSEVRPLKTAVLTITWNYENDENCDFTLTLTVSRKAKHDFKTDVNVVFNSQVIQETGALDVLLCDTIAPTFFNVDLFDIYLGEQDCYKQVIWLYNHCETATKFNVELLRSESEFIKAFELLNHEGEVPPYSRQPIIFQFIPFEFNCHKATLLVSNEENVKFEITLNGTGTVTRKSSPAVRCNPPFNSRFPKPRDLEICPEHIVLRKIPTHSVDQYIFFMTNNTESVLHYSWKRFELWSTLQVEVLPQSGDIEPFETLPLQMFVRSYRFAAVFNGAIECIYYNKTHLIKYEEKCVLLKKQGQLFDSEFVLLPDKNDRVVYCPPTIGMKMPNPPPNKIISMGISAHIYSKSVFDKLECGKQNYSPPPRLEMRPTQDSSPMEKSFLLQATKILQTLIKEIVEAPTIFKDLSRANTNVYYEDLFKPKSQSISGRQMSELLSNFVGRALLKQFGFEKEFIIEKEEGFRMESSVFKSSTELHNSYYHKMLFTSMDQMCTVPKPEEMKELKTSVSPSYVRRES